MLTSREKCLQLIRNKVAQDGGICSTFIDYSLPVNATILPDLAQAVKNLELAYREIYNILYKWDNLQDILDEEDLGSLDDYES